jgi:hypothetical protein
VAQRGGLCGVVLGHPPAEPGAPSSEAAALARP